LVSPKDVVFEPTPAEPVFLLAKFGLETLAFSLLVLVLAGGAAKTLDVGERYVPLLLTTEFGSKLEIERGRGTRVVRW